MTTLTLNLLYEEIIMLQEIMVMLHYIHFPDDLDSTEIEIFDDLYNKIMQS